jgi:hypothetical protein
MNQDPDDEGGQLHTLGLLEQLRAHSGELWGRSSKLYFHVDKLLRQLENPNLHEIANMSFRIELWERHAEHIRWTVAASGSIVLAHAAFDAAIKEWPQERFTLRNGIMLMREYPPTKRGG